MEAVMLWTMSYAKKNEESVDVPKTEVFVASQKDFKNSAFYFFNPTVIKKSDLNNKKIILCQITKLDIFIIS